MFSPKSLFYPSLSLFCGLIGTSYTLFQGKSKASVTPNRTRVRDVIGELEAKAAMLREAEATIERQAVVIKRNNDNFEELTQRFKAPIHPLNTI